MKKTRSILLLTVLLLMLMTTAAFADASDYATAKWASIELENIFGQPTKIEVTFTGVVGQQISDCTCNTPDIDVLYYPEAWDVCYDNESDAYTMLVGEEEKSFTFDELKKYLSENYKTEPLDVIAMVDDGTMTTKLLEGSSYDSFPGAYTILDGKTTGDTLIVVPSMGQAYSTSVSEVGNSSVESFDDLPEGQESLDYIYEFMKLNDKEIGIWIVSENKASELLKQLETGVNEEETNPLDTADEWAKSELTAAIEAGISTERMTNSNYKDNATREEFCEIVMKMYDGLGGQEVVVEENPFTDTTDAETLRANKAGIVNGSDGKFNPNDKLTRQELCTMIIRALGNASVELDNTKEFQKEYADIDKIDDWAVDSMKILNGYDIYKGDGTNLIPTETVDKQTAVILLYRTFNMFK